MASVLILGATSDIGIAIARKFAEEKYDVQLACRNPLSVSNIAADIRIRYQQDCKVYAFDAMDFESHQSFYDSLIPKPDIAICVFGYMTENDIAVNNTEETLKTIHTNYTGAVSILNIIAKDFAARKSGAIAGVSSVAGERGRQSNYIYGSAKAGFTAYLSGLRNSLYKNNVHVLTVLPGFVYTKMTENLDLPKLLTANPAEVALAVYAGVIKKKNVIYVKWFWRWIMYIIKAIPESIFKRKQL